MYHVHTALSLNWTLLFFETVVSVYFVRPGRDVGQKEDARLFYPLLESQLTADTLHSTKLVQSYVRVVRSCVRWSYLAVSQRECNYIVYYTQTTTHSLGPTLYLCNHPRFPINHPVVYFHCSVPGTIQWYTANIRSI